MLHRQGAVQACHARWEHIQQKFKLQILACTFAIHVKLVLHLKLIIVVANSKCIFVNPIFKRIQSRLQMLHLSVSILAACMDMVRKRQGWAALAVEARCRRMRSASKAMRALMKSITI